MQETRSNMANRYITALLIILAATGVEAQTYQSALKLALTDISYQEFIQQPEVKALEDDILSVFKAFKQTDNNEKKSLHYPFCYINATLSAEKENTFIHHTSFFDEIKAARQKQLQHEIVIRGPDYFIP